MENIFYFRRISAIGGTEQFLYEIAKKYHKLDITVFYDEADPQQVKRLRKYVRCQKRIKGQKVECTKAFFNFNIDMIEDVEAKDYYFISHAIYQELGYKPPIHHEKLNHFIGVSQYSTDKLQEYAEIIGREIKAECCYNPLSLEPKKKVVHLISATRLDDNTKGGKRTIKLIEALDRYSREHDRNYLWLIFSNKPSQIILSPNIAVMPGRVDIRPYIADSDYLIQLSNNMETYCYSINEALGYGVPIVSTPLTVLDELNVTDNMKIVCDWDMNNADEVARRIFEDKRKKFEYEPPNDRWNELLVNAPSTYTPCEKITVRATNEWVKRNITDKDRGIIPKEKDTWQIDMERWEELQTFMSKTKITLVERIGKATTLRLDI